MNKNLRRQLKNRKRKLQRRLDHRKRWSAQPVPMFSASNIQYELADKTQAIGCGGIGAMHLMTQRLGLVDALDERLELLKVHLPYHESDHVLNIAYNVLAGNQRLEDLELLRNDETYMNALGAQRIPDPTTAGDFLRRFRAEDVETLQDVINATRCNAWKRRGNWPLGYAVIDVDGTIAPTLGKCKEGMDISYKGVWGYAPLIVSLSNTDEVLYLKNRPGNRPSHDGAVEYMDRAVALVRPYADGVCLRGDTDFSLTEQFDRWDGDGVEFAFGMDAHRSLVAKAEALPKAHWTRLERRAKYTVETEERARPDNVKDRIVEQRGYRNLTLQHEDVAELEYTPTKCSRSYRLIVVRKTIRVNEGQTRLFDEVRYLFYITNRRDLSATEVVWFCNERCDQENTVEQLKNGVNAMRLPVTDLVSNWAYMVICALAWNMKAWFALFIADSGKRELVLRMEFRRFLNTLVRIPCQIVRTGRRIVYRFLGYNGWLSTFFNTFERIRAHQAS